MLADLLVQPTIASSAIKETARLSKDDPSIDADSLRDAAEQFEALLIKQMFKSMRSAMESINKDDEQSGNSDSLQMYTDMLDAEFARVIAEGGGLGIHTMLETQLGSDSRGREKASESIGKKILIDSDTNQTARQHKQQQTGDQRQSLALRYSEG